MSRNGTTHDGTLKDQINQLRPQRPRLGDLDKSKAGILNNLALLHAVAQWHALIGQQTSREVFSLAAYATQAPPIVVKSSSHKLALFLR